jgi:hypothetical protein
VRACLWDRRKLASRIRLHALDNVTLCPRLIKAPPVVVEPIAQIMPKKEQMFRIYLCLTAVRRGAAVSDRAPTVDGELVDIKSPTRGAARGY